MSPSKLSFNSSNPVKAFDADQIVSSVIAVSEAVQEMMTQSGSQPEPAPNRQAHPLHRLATVRREQGVSLTRVARRLSIDIAEARRQENATTDLPLSQIYRWRGILQVPVGELMIEPDEIPNNPIRTRGEMIKMMKTVRSILETSKEESVTILAQMLADQLIALMPELKSVSPWPTVGQAREHREPGQAAFRRFDATISRRLED